MSFVSCYHIEIPYLVHVITTEPSTVHPFFTKAINTLDYSFQCKRNIGHSHSKEGSAEVSRVVKQPPSQYKPCCVYGDERFQSLKTDQWQEPEVTHTVLHWANCGYLSAMHSVMHTYTFTHTHWTLSVLFMHRFTSLACSENTTRER